MSKLAGLQKKMAGTFQLSQQQSRRLDARQ